MYYILFFCLILSACSTPSTPSTTTTKVSTDSSTLRDLKKADITIYADLRSEKETIAAEIEAGKIYTYSVLDGAGMIAESTTYFRDEDKQNPCKTHIIYLTGGATDVYWLRDNFMMIDVNGTMHLYQNEQLIQSYRNDEIIDLSPQDQLEASKLPAPAIEIITNVLKQ